VRPARGRARRRDGSAVLIPLEEIVSARNVVRDVVVRAPLLRLQAPESPAEIWLKLECLQPIGSFKLRGAANAIRRAPTDALADGVVTASAGNMAQGVAWVARELGIPATIVVPEHAPETKLAAIERLGGEIVKVPYDRWWQAIEESRFDDAAGFFVHPVMDELVMAGNGTIGLELVEDLADIDVVLVPWGGGGLTTGIANALAARSPRTQVQVCEPATGAAFAAAFAAGEPVPFDYRPSFVDGAGSKGVLPPMWERARPLVSDAHAVSLDDAAAAVRLLAERAHVVAEGAGALAVAVALSGRAGSGRIVCIVSGGNIDPPRLSAILDGGTPD
jgi:threonine dehydratase